MEFLKGVNGLYYIIGLVVTAMALERVVPWRKGVKIDLARWTRNFSLVFYSTIILSLIPLIAGYAGAAAAQARGLGLMNMLNVPLWANMVITVVAMDFVFFGQHRILHKWYFFWRIHRAHHTDAHIDVTTSLRFHPFEAVFRSASEVAVIFAIGAAPEGILLSFAVDVFANTVTHANIVLPARFERFLSPVIITPRMHRLHHAAAPEHQYSNFGTLFSLWDRMAGTFCAPDNLRDDEVIGVEGPENMAYESFANLALDPFRTPDEPAIPRPGRERLARDGAIGAKDAADAGS